jgi:SAUR family protein
MVSRLLLRPRKSNIGYISLRSEPRTFPQLICDHFNSEEGFVTAEGRFSVDVGKERIRFSLPISCLNHPLIRALMERSAEEFGMDQSGVLTIPCDVQSFEHVIWLVHSDPSPSDQIIEDIVKYYDLNTQSYLTGEAESRC